MSCRELVELVTGYLDGALSPEDTRRFEQHIEHCTWCARYLEQMRTTIVTVGRVDEQSLSPEARAAFLAAFRDWRAGAQPPRER